MAPAQGRPSFPFQGRPVSRRRGLDRTANRARVPVGDASYGYRRGGTGYSRGSCHTPRRYESASRRPGVGHLQGKQSCSTGPRLLKQ